MFSVFYVVSLSEVVKERLKQSARNEQLRRRISWFWGWQKQDFEHLTSYRPLFSILWIPDGFRAFQFGGIENVIYALFCHLLRYLYGKRV